MDSQRISEVWPGWKVVRMLGRGSFGCVYEVERNQFGVVEKAAVKTLTIPENSSIIDEMRGDGYDNESIAERMKDELEGLVKEYYLMAELRGHSNVVNGDDLKYVQHTDEPGYDVFIRMELLTPLSKAAGNNLDPQTAESMALRLGKDICRALQLCEKKNIVHRDIKSQNILVSEFGDYKLGDFGIARTMEHTTNATKTGTYGYMAPEVYQGRPYGHAADICSLGLVLYWLLNEKRLPFLPFPPIAPKRSEEIAAWNKRLRGAPIPAPKNGNEALKRVVLKACAYEAKDRFASADEMLQALELVESGRYEETQGTEGDRTQEKTSGADSFGASGGLFGTDNVAGTIGGSQTASESGTGTRGGSTGTVGGTAGTIGAGWGTAETIGVQKAGKPRDDRTPEFEKTVGVKSEPKAPSPRPAASKPAAPRPAASKSVVPQNQEQNQHANSALMLENPRLMLLIYIVACAIPGAYMIYQDNNGSESALECLFVSLILIALCMIPTFLGCENLGTFLGIVPALMGIAGVAVLLGFDPEGNGSYVIMVLGVILGYVAARALSISMKAEKEKKKRNKG